MIKRIIEISNPSYLRLKYKQLIIEQNSVIVDSIAIEDIGVLILEHSAIIITQPLIIACQKNNTIIIFCDERHLPYSTILPIAEGNRLHQKILKQQINISEAKRKNLWKQITEQKIKNQANTLKLFDKKYKKLALMAKSVKSGDKDNREAVASKYYWKELFGDNFIRNQNADDINAILNYGYSLIRALVARNIVAGGLHPAIGLFHHNQYNGLCLADDLMEVFRPWVDAIAFNIFQENPMAKIEHNNKIPFLELLSKSVIIDKRCMPLMVSMHYLIANLRRCYNSEDKKLIYPQLN